MSKSLVRTRALSRLLFLLLVASTRTALAQDLAPEIQLGIRGVVSANAEISSGETTNAVSDFSDSAVLVGARQKLFNNYRGQVVIGFQFPDADSDLGQVFFHRVFVRLENKKNVFIIGRSRLSSTLVEFPTMRDDDALLITDVVSPFSEGVDTEDNQFGNIIQVTRYLTPRIRLELHGEYYAETNRVEQNFELNAAGIVLAYQVPRSLRWNRALLDQVGISFDGFFTDRTGIDDTWDEMLKNIKLSAIFNVFPDPVHFVDFRHQTIFNVGFDDVDRVASFAEMARARSIATFTSVGYTYRRYEWPTLRTALSLGYKTFPDLKETTNQLVLLGNFFYRVGANFDVVVQVGQYWYSGDLKNLYETSTTFQIGFIYGVDQRFNNQFDDRDSILNLEHGYIE